MSDDALSLFGMGPNATSYFSPPGVSLDPALFKNDRLHEGVRATVFGMLTEFLRSKGFNHAEHWLEAWLAGSGVSYNWEAAREPGDLDCLVGVHYERFREVNPKYVGLGDDEIAAHLNDLLWQELCPKTEDWEAPGSGKHFELTYYVNPDSTDIRNINPYAAYNLRNGVWTVHPSQLHVVRDAKLEQQADADNKHARDIVSRYTHFTDVVHNAQNPAARANGEVYLNAALQQARDLYDTIHHGRQAAFSRTGRGYRDAGNYRWQAGKERGTVPALKALATYQQQLEKGEADRTYGVELPDVKTLLLRAALWQD